MKKNYYFTLIALLITACISRDYKPDMCQHINRRIEILENSYKFSVIHEDMQMENFMNLKYHIDYVLSNSKIDLKKNHDIFEDLFSKYNIAFANKSENINDLRINILIGLDELIFKYLPSRLNFSEYNAIVVPNNTNIKLGETLKTKIYLTVSDSLYEPEIKFFHLDSDGKVKNEYNIPYNKGIGDLRIVANKKGNHTLQGISIYSNEFGSRDTIDWNYEFIVE